MDSLIIKNKKVCDLFTNSTCIKQTKWSSICLKTLEKEVDIWLQYAQPYFMTKIKTLIQETFHPSRIISPIRSIQILINI